MNNALKKILLFFIAILFFHQVLIAMGIWLPEILLRFVYGSFSFIVFGLFLYSVSRLIFSLFVKKEINRRAVEFFKTFFVVIGVPIGLSIIGVTNKCAVQLDEFNQENLSHVTFTDIEAPNINSEYYRINIRGQEINIPVHDYIALDFRFSDVNSFDGLILITGKNNDLTVMASSEANDVHEKYFSPLNPYAKESFSSFELYNMTFDVKPDDLGCTLPSIAFNYSELVSGFTLLGIKNFTEFIDVKKVAKYEQEDTGFIVIGSDATNELIVRKTYVPSANKSIMVNVEYRGESTRLNSFYSLIYNKGKVVESPVWLKNFELFANQYAKGSCGGTSPLDIDEGASGTNIGTYIEVCKEL